MPRRRAGAGGMTLAKDAEKPKELWTKLLPQRDLAGAGGTGFASCQQYEPIVMMM